MLAVLAVTVSAQCPEVQEDCQFQYTNIRLESSTPTLSSLHGVYDPSNPGDVVGSPPPDNGALLDEVVTPSDPSNPFSSVDLSSFSADDLEARRELLLAILDQTNAELGIPLTAGKSVRAAVAKSDERTGPIRTDDIVVMKGEDDFEDALDVEAMDMVVETETVDDAAADVVVETQTGADAKGETKGETKEDAPVADDGGSSFFKKLIGGSSNPTSSARTIPVVAGALTLLMTL